MSGPILKLANEVLADLTTAILHAPHTNTEGIGVRHVRALDAIKKDVQLIVNLAGEAAGIERDHDDQNTQLVRRLAPALADSENARLDLEQRLATALEGVVWVPRHPSGKDFEAQATRTIPRNCDRAMVDGQPYICGDAEHDGLDCVVPLRFVPGHTYPAVVDVEPDAVPAESPNR